MACAFPDIDLEESYGECSTCLQKYKDPKQLPCSHRYCNGCLTNLVKVDSLGNFECPLCMHESKVKEVKRKVMTNTLLISSKSGQVKKCISCAKTLLVTVFCSKCNDYLCDECYYVHVNSKMFLDHKEHIISVASITEGSARPVQPESSARRPKCHFHELSMAEVYCSTCGNVPICRVCISGDHNAHQREDAKTLANLERGKLKEQMAEMENHKTRIYSLPKMVEDAMQRLRECEKEVTERLIKEHERQSQMLREQIRVNSEMTKKREDEMARRRAEEEREIERQLQEEMKQLKATYDKIIEEKNKEYDDLVKETTKKFDEEDEQLLQELFDLENEAKGKRKTNH